MPTSSSRCGFGEVPAELVQLPQNGERLEHALGRLRIVAPVPPGESHLHHLLTGAETVEDVAAGDPCSCGPSWMPQRRSPSSFGHGRPDGLSIAKSAERAKAGATQHRAAQRSQSARRCGRGSTEVTPTRLGRPQWSPRLDSRVTTSRDPTG